MKPARFEYVAPKTDDEAIAALVRYDGNARLLAGGQSLIPLLNLRVARPEALIDLGQCSGLAELRREDGYLVCGTMVRQHNAEHSALVAECCPLLAKTIRYLGPATIRNRATMGGTLAHADRIAELMDDPAKRKLLGERGKQRVERELGWHRSREELLRAYAAVLQTEG